MNEYLRSVKKLFLIFIPLAMCFKCSAQSTMIKEVFKSLPTDKVFDLTVATRDSMLKGKTYYPADNDSTEIAAYNYGISPLVNDYLYVSLSFETGQRGSGMIEIRSFKMTNGENMVLVSQTGGVWQITYNQHDISTYIYNKDKKLIPYKKKVLPSADESIFMKPSIPDSVKNVIVNNSNMTFDLSQEKLMLSLNSNYISDNESLRKWLKGDRIYFEWARDRFVTSKIDFQ